MGKILLSISAIIGAITAISVFVRKLYTIVKRFDKKLETVDNLKQENVLIIKSTFAICDGLHQLGCNGPVSKAKEELQDYIIKN